MYCPPSRPRPAAVDCPCWASHASRSALSRARKASVSAPGVIEDRACAPVSITSRTPRAMPCSTPRSVLMGVVAQLATSAGRPTIVWNARDRKPCGAGGGGGAGPRSPTGACAAAARRWTSAIDGCGPPSGGAAPRSSAFQSAITDPPTTSALHQGIPSGSFALWRRASDFGWRPSYNPGSRRAAPAVASRDNPAARPDHRARRCSAGGSALASCPSG